MKAKGASSFKEAFKNRKPAANGSPKSPEASPSLEETEMAEQSEVKAVEEVNVPKSFSISEADLIEESDEEVREQEKVEEKVDPTAAAMLRIAASMENMMQRQEAVRQIPFNEMKPVTPWNPEGKRNRKEFARPTFLQGVALNPLMHTEAEMALFNKLKPGRYLNRRVEVQKSGDGAINVQWPGAKLDARMQFYSEFPSITLMLNAVIAEREAKERKRQLGLVDDDDEV